VDRSVTTRPFERGRGRCRRRRRRWFCTSLLKRARDLEASGSVHPRSHCPLLLVESNWALECLRSMSLLSTGCARRPEGCPARTLLGRVGSATPAASHRIVRSSGRGELWFCGTPGTGSSDGLGSQETVVRRCGSGSRTGRPSSMTLLLTAQTAQSS